MANVYQLSFPHLTLTRGRLVRLILVDHLDD
jgi:hypothetical protein